MFIGKVEKKLKTVIKMSQLLTFRKWLLLPSHLEKTRARQPPFPTPWQPASRSWQNWG